MKKIISFLLVFLLLISVFSINITAVSAEKSIQKSGGNSGVATITVKDQGEELEVRKVAVGDTISIKYYMNVNNVTEGNIYQASPTEDPQDSQGYITNIDARILFDNAVLQSSYTSKDALKVFPIVGSGATINPYDEKTGGLLYNTSSIGWNLCFNSDDCVLFDITFTVLQAGETTIESKIKDMQPLSNNIGEYLCKDWEVLSQWDKNIVIESDSFPEITFDSKGGSDIDPMPIEKPVSADNLPTPVKDGFIFKGWSKTDEQESYVTGSITEETTLYAVWEKEKSIIIDERDKYQNVPDDTHGPIFVLGAQTRDASDKNGAGLRFLVRISDQYNELFESAKVQYGCALYAKDAYISKYGQKDLLAEYKDDKDIEAGRILDKDKCYKYEASETKYNIYSVVIKSNKFIEGESLYQTDFIIRPYVLYIDNNGKQQCIYYNEPDNRKAWGKGYYSNFKYASTSPLEPILQAASQGVNVNDEGIAQAGASDDTYLLGDAYEDWKLSINDATYIQMCLAGLTGRNLKLYNAFRFKADANQNNKIDIGDTTLIQQKLANMSASGVGNTFKLPIDELDGGLWSPLSR